VASGARLLTDAKTGQADAGDITVHSTSRTEFAGFASARPGASGGIGGDVSISSDGALLFSGAVDVGDPPRQGTISLNSAPVDPGVVSVPPGGGGSGGASGGATGGA
jgi:hypothetical protein